MTHLLRRYGKKIAVFTTLGGATTYYFSHIPSTQSRSTIPYIPAPFIWSSIHPSILARFTLPHPTHDSILWNLASTIVIGSVGTIAKAFQHLNDTTVINLNKFTTILHDPHRTQGIITISNHESVLDDPLLWGALPFHTLFSTNTMRWVLGAADICYTTLFRSCFFALGQTIPTVRGEGIYQPGVDFAIHVINKGAWVHVYPEAKVVQNQGGKMIRFKWGVGRMIMEAAVTDEATAPPIVIPIWHKGMDLVKPLNGTRLVHLNKPITLVFGDPVDFSDLLEEWKSGKLNTEQARIKITQRCYDAVEVVRKEYHKYGVAVDAVV